MNIAGVVRGRGDREGGGGGGGCVGEGGGVIGNVVWVNTVQLMNSLWESYVILLPEWFLLTGVIDLGSKESFTARPVHSWSAVAYSFLVFLFCVRFFC